MNAAERILTRLDAYECLAGARLSARALKPALEPVVVHHPSGADFGTTLTGQQSVAELQDLLNVWNNRMTGLGTAYSNFASSWANRDPAAFTSWTADWQQLQARYTAAVQQAQAAISNVPWAVPNATWGAQAEFDGVMKAIRQCYPPDGCPTRKGDFDDLNNRLMVATQALGGAAPVYQDIQPTATDLSLELLKTTAPIDPVAMATGAQAPKGPLGEVLKVTGLVPPPGPSAPSRFEKLRLVLMGAFIGGGGYAGARIGGLIGGVVGAAIGFGIVEILGGKSAPAPSPVSKLSRLGKVAALV